MSRIGKLPIEVPKGVTVEIEPGNRVLVKGPRGQLQRSLPLDMNIALENSVLQVTRPTDQRQHRMLHGLTRSLLNNMVVGVTDGFKKMMQIEGVGYRAEMQGDRLVLFMGYSKPVEMETPKGISFNVDRGGRSFSIEGIDKELVGLTAARIRAVRPPEPYHGKGIRYQGEAVRRKQGKTGK